ncbi:hypothetical protein B0I35DRAFT_485517 [Stachybotrys elegans]|uniref:Uncharacterized protein n=1 Tax=Stachybotrys elegans TaxID=80388 RepID=A0A8K0SC57_9HYPO|nr:hypothetical protein B0I35DRAFT_485517 [Stachybotrys elegans]
MQFSLVPGETAVGCCPEGYSCTNFSGNTCIQIASDPVTVSVGTCEGTSTADLTTITLEPIPRSTNTANGATILVPPTLFAPMFQLNYRSTDLASGIFTVSFPSLKQ